MKKTKKNPLFVGDKVRITRREMLFSDCSGIGRVVSIDNDVHIDLSIGVQTDVGFYSLHPNDVTLIQ
jgi:hypothetical protein